MIGGEVEDIPLGPENAITRAELAEKWGCTDRQARQIIAKLRTRDNGDNYVIVSHSSGHGYYRTDDLEAIEHFVNEMSKRARNTFLPLRKARRVLKRARREGENNGGGSMDKNSDRHI